MGEHSGKKERGGRRKGREGKGGREDGREEERKGEHSKNFEEFSVPKLLCSLTGATLWQAHQYRNRDSEPFS